MNAGLVRFLQAGTLTAAASAGVGWWSFGAFEVAAAMIGASAVAAAIELLLSRAHAGAPAAPEARRWSVDDLEARALPVAARDRQRFEHLLALAERLRAFEEDDGRLPLDFDPFVRETMPELVR